MQPGKRPQRTPDDRETVVRGHGAKTQAVRDGAIVAILPERTVGRAAKRAGIGEKTLRRRMTEDAAFQADPTAARKAAFDAGMTRIQVLTAPAVATLEDLLEAKQHPTVRLGAARTLVELGVNRHAETILSRLVELERRQPETQAKGGRR